MLRVFAAFLLLGLTAHTAVAVESPKIDFDSQIKPLLSDRCFVCHGPDAAKRKADLRLDLEASAKEYAIVSGKPAESEVVSRINSDDPDTLMPPSDSNLQLSSNERKLIEQWIAEGAEWQNHWAFNPPADVTPPTSKDDQWSQNDIDRFVRQRHMNNQLKAASPADRATLLRRVTFDLTGLPPTLAELDAFLADKSPNAYEQVVDRLLKSEKFGERMASNWLDVARYSDTFGFQVDRDRYVWPYRDWVIRAFNNNLPYDQFVTQQLAGDLLPNATDEQILATTFNRLHPQKVEGGSVPEEFRIEYVADRTQTFATAFLGLTMECCRCHDHKYDPLSQKEYYQISAYFDNIDEAGLYSYFTRSTPTPTLLMTDEATKQKIADAEARVTAALTQLQRTADEQVATFETWAKGEHEATVPNRIELLDFEKVGGGNASVPGKVGNAVRLSGDDGIGLKVGNFTRSQPFSITLWMQTPDVKERAVVFHRSRAWTDAASRGYEMLIVDGKLQASLVHFWPGNAISIRTTETLPINEWQHVTITYDGSSRASGLQIYVNGKAAKTEVVQDNLYKNITGGGGDNVTIGQRFRDRGFKSGLVDEFAVYDRELMSLEIAQLHDGTSLKSALASAAKADDEQRERLLDVYLHTTNDEFKAALAAVKKARDERNKIVDGVQEIMVMRERATKRQTYLLQRGAYDARGEEVSATTPESLPPLTKDTLQNRLGLARWLTQPDHPLTGRVAVNRIWQMIFGQGLVRTPEDFGRQGQPPSHPQLLDWLARDFAKDWDVKRLLKQIVMSSTYCQSSTPAADVAAKDPENIWLARASSYRLPAEMLRDHALAVSGLLSSKLGGPPAKPYEVEVSFKPSKRDKGEGLYRRSVYTYWRRTGPAPVMMTLDASKRDVCRVKRERTSTPLQTFVLMNGPQFVEAARMTAQSLLKQHGEDTDAALAALFRTLTSRAATESELTVLRQLFTEQLAYFQQDAKRADAYLKIGDTPPDAKLDKSQLAALSSVANALFSFDDVVMKR